MRTSAMQIAMPQLARVRATKIDFFIARTRTSDRDLAHKCARTRTSEKIPFKNTLARVRAQEGDTNNALARESRENLRRIKSLVRVRAQIDVIFALEIERRKKCARTRTSCALEFTIPGRGTPKSVILSD